MSARKRGLGRGLDALLSNASSEAPAAQPTPAVGEPTPRGEALEQIPVDLIQRGKYQPRRDMHPEALEELAESIRRQGLLQPIIVRPIDDQRYEIIAGERRWRASQLAGLDKIPVIVKPVADDAAIAMALIENIQREDLNAMEEAVALARLRDEFELTQQEVANAVGKSRAAVANLLRLMTLREDVKILLEHGDLEFGHAKALLGLPPEEQSAAASQVVARGLSVRQTESLVRNLLVRDEQQLGAESAVTDPDIKRLQTDLGERVGVPVQIQHTAKGKGKLVFKYASLDELEGILEHIK